MSIIILNAVSNLIKKEYENSNSKLFVMILFLVTFSIMFIGHQLGFRINAIYVILASFVFAIIKMVVDKV